ncbi:hypothetical protein MTR62_07695 [Novosphingobium sp. 1949]|uniref:Lipoprotein n=1 Tax=Novosphingobium organovorum TaxID=2930092 RepID=A0ABT0BC62_9SPHN|nr:hypothetical protein [Novosphingobium organovorum]MCJ2182573.1 hypothetical protein [Novosphingobium organovorum]
MKLSSLFVACAAVVGCAGCAGEPLRFGQASSTAWPAPDQRTFAMVGTGAPQDAVRNVLVRYGFQESADARLRVEVGYAVRRKALSVRGPQGQPSGAPETIIDDASSAPASLPASPPQTVTLSPAARRTVSFCTKQAHVLTLAFVDRASGAILSRGGATLGRCKADEAQVLSKLATSAVLSARDGQTRDGHMYDGHTMAGS